jgi:two-component system, response regulator YesN
LYRAVIVDDEPFMLEGMRLMIDWSGCGFTLCGEASTAQEALHLIDTFKPHLLITDVKMPGMLGTDLAVIVHHYHPDTVLLFFSGYRDFAYAQSAIKSKAFAYLNKPIDKDEVHQTLHAVRKELDKRSLAGQEEGEQLPILRDHVLRRIATGDMGEESLLRAGVLLNLTREDPCYCAVITAKSKPLSEGALLMLSGCGGTPFLLSPCQCGLCFKQIERNLLKLTTLKESLENSFDIITQWSVGYVGRGPEGFSRSLIEALDAMGVLFEQCGKLRLYRPADEAVSAWMLQISLPQMVTALEEDSPGALTCVLNGLCTLARRMEPPLFALRYMLKALETMLLLRRTRSGWPALLSDQLKPLWNTENLSREEWLLAFCETMQSLKAHACIKDTYPVPVRAVLDIVGKSYDKPLSIGSIAANLNLNPAYLGQLILRCTGQTFHTLLLDARISQACRLLKQTSHTIGEIAYMVGFRDVDYFSRLFRSRMAMNPNAYRGPAGEKEDAG